MVHPGFNTGLTNTIAGIGKDSLRDFFVEVGMGNIPKYSTVHKFGSASAIAASNFEHIWEGGGETNMTFLSATSSLQVSSSHAADTLAGSGAREVKIYAIDSNWNEVVVFATLSGTTPVNLSGGPFYRVNRAFVTNVGTYGVANTGYIDIATSTGQTQAYIPATVGKTQKTQYTIPAGKIGILVESRNTVQSTKVTTVRLLIRENGTLFSSNRQIGEWVGVADRVEEKYLGGSILQPKTDVWFVGKTTTGTTANITGTFDIILFTV